MQATNREWGLFGLRWVFPVGLLVFAFIEPKITNQDMLIPIVIVVLLAVLSNLAIALMQILEFWAGAVTIGVLAIDVLLTVSAVYYADVRLAWVVMLPIGLIGLYFGLIPGVVAGGVLAVLQLILQLVVVDHNLLTVTLLLVLLIGYPATGALTALMAHESEPGSEPRVPLRERAQRRIRSPLAKKDTEKDTENNYVEIIYDIVEVLSASRLDPVRVLDAVVGFGLEGLQKIGIAPPLYGAVLLFDDGEDKGSSVLRIARASRSVRSGDYDITISGKGGAVAEALATREPVLINTAKEDVELSLFESFGKCASALCLPLSTGKDSFGVLVIASQAKNAFSDMHVDLIRAIANQAAASLHNAELYVSLREQRDRIIEVEKVARAQLAANLHDGPTQSVSAITMRLNYIRRLIDRNPEEVLNELYKIEELSRKTAKEIRAMLFTLRPKSLEKGLASGLDQLAIQMKETYNQNVKVEVAEQCDQLLDSQTTTTLFSIVTETVNNARKHAEASLINVSLSVQEQVFVLTIRDNGKGFNVDEALERAKEREGHLGLINLYERAALIEGSLHIESSPESGTNTVVAVPLNVIELRRAEEAER